MTYLLLQGSASHLPLRDESVQCVVTSPPYWGLRQYAGEQREVWGGDADHVHEWGSVERKAGGGQTDGVRWQHTGGGPSGHPAVASGSCACGAWYGALGLEPTPDLYVEHIVAIFREVRRVLRADGTLWLNLGDSYASTGGHTREGNTSQRLGRGNLDEQNRGYYSSIAPGLKVKDLVGIPWMVAFALRADGWYLRSDIIWAKPNPMPESVTDRPTKSHEYLFLMSKSGDTMGWRHRDGRWVRWPDDHQPVPDYRWRDALDARAETATEPTDWRTETYIGDDGDEHRRWSRVNLWSGFDYFYDADASREPAIHAGRIVKQYADGAKNEQNPNATARGFTQHDTLVGDGRNARSVWEIATQPYPGAHFATFPEDLPRRCILAGSAPGDIVLDPFAGSGTTVRVANRLGRRGVGLDLSREYLVEQALARVDPLAAAQRLSASGVDDAQGTLAL